MQLNKNRREGESVMYKNQELIDQVIEELKLDIANNDWTVIEELLSFVPVEFLKGFLPK